MVLRTRLSYRLSLNSNCAFTTTDPVKQLPDVFQRWEKQESTTVLLLAPPPPARGNLLKSTKSAVRRNDRLVNIFGFQSYNKLYSNNLFPILFHIYTDVGQLGDLWVVYWRALPRDWQTCIVVQRAKQACPDRFSTFYSYSHFSSFHFSNQYTKF